MKISKVRCFVLLMLILAARSGAQEHNSVPLTDPSYEIIEMGVMRGVILPPPSARPWSEHIIKQKLWEMMADPKQILSIAEIDVVDLAIDSFQRKDGLELKDGRYRTEHTNYTLEIGVGWESFFYIKAPDSSFASTNAAKVYAGGDIDDFVSWNVTALGEFLYLKREDPPSIRETPLPIFPYSFSKTWDGGVLPLRDSEEYVGWPDDPALACGFEAEINGVFLDDRLQMRLGRIRHDWGHGSDRASLFLSRHARPFASLEGTYMPLSWMNVSFLTGGLEYYRADSSYESKGPFANLLTVAHVDLDPAPFLHFSVGGAATLLKKINPAFLFDFEFRLPGLFTIWAGLFVDSLSSGNFFSNTGNSYAYQAGVKSLVHWLPFAVFTFSYTRVEPYCYSGGGDRPSAFASGGEGLGYYLPPNSDELLARLEFMPLPPIKTYVQFQMIRHGANVPGSSLYDERDGNPGKKYFLNDGVYQWDHIIKVGGSFNLKSGGIPLALYAELGGVISNYTINGTAGVGNEAEYEPLLDDPVYRDNYAFLFSIGFRLFP